MVSEVQTIYRGHTIRWSDNSDEWTCYDLSDKARSSPKLSLIKASIDRLYLTERKSNAIPCFEISHGGQRCESNVTEYLGPDHQRAYANVPEKVVHKVAVVATRSGSERPARRQTELGTLMPVSAEAEAAWAIYADLNAKAGEAVRLAREALDAVPRMTPDQIKPLVALFERDQ